MKIARLHNDESGESHWGETEVDFTWQDFAPPARPLGATPFIPAGAVGFIQGEVGWVGDWHPVPRRQYMYTLQGVVEVSASDGVVRRLAVGQGALIEDTEGKGHFSQVIGDEPLVMIVVTLAD